MAKQLNVNLGFTADTSQAKKQLQDLQNQLTNLTKTPVGLGDKFTKEIQEASSAAAELKAHLSNATNVNTGTLDFSKLNQSLGQGKKSLADYGQALRSMGPEGQKAFMSLAQSVAQAEIPIKRSNALLTDLWTTLKNTARWQISSSVLHGFMGAIQSAYGYAQDLNRSLTDIRIVTGQSVDQMARFAEQANKAAKNLSTTTTEYTNASLIYYQQGLDDTEVQKRTDITIKMANAAGQSAEIVSDQLTAIWNNFDDGSQSLEYYADVITALGAATASSTDEIATGLEKFAAVADTVGLSYEYATAALATVTAETRQSADVVGTAFKTLFARIQDLELGKTLDDGTDLGTYSESLLKVGINIKDTSGELKGMDIILEEMAAKWDTLGNAEKTALAQNVAGVRQYTQLIALMDNWDVMQENLNTAENATGTLDEQQEAYAEGWEAARDRVRAALEGIYSTIIDDQAFIGLLNTLEKVITMFDNLLDSMGGLGGLLPTLGVLLTKMFGPQLAQGIKDAAYNLKMMTAAGREAVQQEKQDTINEFATMMADDTTSGVSGKTAKNVYTEELRLQSEMAEKAEKMSGIEKQRTQILMDQLKVYGEQAIEAGKLVEASEERRAAASTKLRVNATQAAQNQGKEADQSAITKSLTDIRVTAESSAAVKKSFQEMQNGSIKTSEAIKKISKAINEVNNQDPDLLLEDDKAQLTKLLYQLQTMPDKAEEIGAEIQAIMNRALDFSKDGGVELGLGDLSEVNEYVNSVQGVQAANDQLSESNKRVKVSQDGVRESIETSKGVQSTWADEIIECANTAMSFASALQMLSGMWDTLNNPDMSGWEKFLSIFTTAAMVVPMFINAFKGVKAMLDKDTIATALNTAAKFLNALASKGQAEAADKAEEEIKEQTEATNKDTIATTANAAVKKTIGKDGKTYYSQGGKRISKEAGEKLLQEGGEKVAKEAGEEVVEKGASKGLSKLGGSLKNIGGGLKSVGKAVLNVGKSFGVTFAFVAAGAAMVAGAIKIWNKDADAAKQAAEEAKVAAENADKARQAYSEFKSSLDGYTSAKDGLASLTEGTAEFRQGVLDANAEAMKLIDTVEGLEYSINKDTGLIEIDQESLEKAQNAELDKMQNAQTASMIASQNAKDADLKAKQTDFNRKVAKDKGGNWNSDNGAAVLGAAGAGAATGAIIGTILPGVGNAIGAAVGGAIGLVGGAITGLVGSIAANSDQTDYEVEANAALAEYYGENGDAAFTEEGMKQALENAGLEVDQSYIDSLLENKDATKELITALHANTEANDALNQQLAVQAVEGSSEAVQESEYKDQITNILGEEMDDYRQDALKDLEDEGWGTEGINSMSGKNDKQAKAVFEEYAKAAGLEGVELSTIKGTDKNRRFVYKDAEGNEQEVSLDTMRSTVAADRATEKAGKKAEDMAEVFEDMEAKDVNAVEAMKTGDISKLTGEQLAKIQSGELTAESMGLSDADLQKLDLGGGFKDKWNEMLGLPSEFEQEMAEMAKKVEKEMEGISLDGLDEELRSGMSLETMKAIQGQIDNMNLGPMGAEAGKIYTEGLNKMLEGIDTEDQQAALEQLGAIDWSNADAMEQADAIMKEFGVDIDTSDKEWQEFAAKMRDANRALPDFSKMSEDLKTVSSIMGGLEFGSVIKDEDYDKLMAYNDEWEEFFVLQADGTRKFIGDKEQMMQATRENIQAQREELNVAKERQEAMKNMKDINWNFDANAAEKLAGGDGKDGKVSEETLNAYNKEHGTDYATSDELVGNIMADETQKMLDASQEMKDMLADSGYDEATIQEILNEAREGNKERLDAMLSSVSDFMGQDLEAATTELDEMMASTATSIEELNMMLDSGQTNVDAYNKQVNVLAQSATSLEELHKIRDLSDGALSAEQYGQALLKLAESFENCKDEQEAYREALASGNEETVQAAEAALEASIEAGELAEKYSLNADEIEDYAKRLQSLNKDQKISASEATRLAAANMRLDRGVGNLNDNLENYQKALKKSNKGSAEWSKALSDLKTDLADIVNVADGEMLSDTFAEATLDSKDLKLALDGNVDAILRLRLAAADDIIANLEIEGEDNIATVNENWEYLKANMAAGISTPGVDQTELINSFNEMIAAGNMTKEQIEAALSGLNVSANVKTTYVAAKQQIPLTVTETTWMDNGTMTVPVPDGAGGYTNETYTSTKRVTKTYDAGTEETDVMVPQYTIEGTTDEGGVTTAFVEAPAPPKVSHSQTTSGKKENGGGGGGGSKKEPQKAEKKKKSDVVDRYKQTEDALDDLRNVMNDVNKSMDRLYGASRITQIQRTNDLLQNEVKLLQQKKKEAQAYLALDKKELDSKASAAGVSFAYDENGNITNYDAQMTKLFNQLDGAIDAANRDGDASEEEQKKIDEIQKKIDELKDAMSQYEETRELLEDLDDELDDKFYEWQDNNAEIINYKFEIEMELKDDELQLAEYYMDKISDDFYQRAEGIAFLNKQMDVQTSRLGDYTIYMDELKRAYAANEISQAAYIEGLNEITDGALDNAAALQELDKQMMAYYGETLTAASEELDKFTERMEHQQSVLEHYLTIMDLMGESTNYAKVGEVLVAQGDMLKDQMETTKQEYLMYAQEADENYLAWMSAENEEEAELYKQRYEDSLALASEAQEEYLSLAESYGEKLREILDNSLSQYAQDLENALTGGTSFDQMSTRWERAASLQEEYLTNTNKIYETTKLMNQAQKQIDKSTSSVAKERLKQFINETNQLQKKGKLSQFELEIQQAKYELLLAELALEDARDAKQQVRLSRDAEGNFGYIYTANAEEVSDAEEKFLEAQNNLYNTALEGANDYAQKYQQTLNEMYDELVDLQQQYLDGAFETEEEYQNAVLETKQYYYSLLEGYSDLYTVAVSTDARVLEDAWTTEFNSMIYNTENWKVEVEKYVGQVGKAFDQWESDMDRLASDVGIGGDLENLTEKVSEVTTEHEKLTDLVNSKVLPALKSEILEVRNLTTEYAKLRKVQLEAIKGFEQVAEKAQEEKKKEVKDEKPKNVAPSATPPKKPSKPKSPQGDGKLNVGDVVTFTGQYYNDSYGTKPTGDVFSGQKDAVKITKIVDNPKTKNGQNYYIHIGNAKSGQGYTQLGWVKKDQLTGYDTGGYTGKWGSYGKLAMLHEKELVLNKKDTQNLLETITLMRDINKMIDMQAAMMQMDNIMKSPGYSAKKPMLQQEALEQKVSIEANFPNVASHFEIEEAFMNLVNQASQYANRK